MKKLSRMRTAAWIMSLGVLLQSAAYIPANADSNAKVSFNEVCSKNTSYPSSDGNFYDWIELYNNDKNEADISGWGLSDKESEPYRYVFPDGTRIPANGRLLVYCDSDAAANNSRIAPFGLSASGETLILTDKSGNAANTLTFGALASDTSYGQYPDGSGEFYNLSCTPR
ncbi:MAG TPA: lamin tail domain-containing protein [Ruminococcus sp.]|nr:lamin tail domain-containing protein [Ruminococcus sp.]